MEDILKHLLKVEREAEEQVQQADAARRKMIQEGLERARNAEAEFEKQAEARRKPFLDNAEEKARQHIAELEANAAEQQRTLREQAATNEEEAVQSTLALLLGKG
jgi:V/A-type H+-transporting ATPase subunit G/H